MSSSPRADKLARGHHVAPAARAEDLEREGTQLREALRDIQQLEQVHSDKIVLLEPASGEEVPMQSPEDVK